MEWIDVEKELPKIRKRFLARCINESRCVNENWNGIVDVYFDPHTGWNRCEFQNDEKVYVKEYAEHPCPDWPWEDK